MLQDELDEQAPVEDHTEQVTELQHQLAQAQQDRQALQASCDTATALISELTDQVWESFMKLHPHKRVQTRHACVW